MAFTAHPTLDDEGRHIVEHLGGRWRKRGGMCRCPAHADTSPSLSVRIGARRLLLHCFAGCSATMVLDALKIAGLLNSSPPSQGSTLPVVDHAPSLARAASRIWSEARIIAGTPAERYLLGRSISTNSAELRYHPRTAHGPKPHTQFRPALVAAVRDDTGLVGIHRTFLDRRTGQIAALPAPKLGLGRLGRGAVRFGAPRERLGIAEGLETALSASILFGFPCWATLGTERFRHVSLPAGIQELTLFLDHDEGGRRAEALARKAFVQVPVISACRPSRVGQDWNDVLRQRSATA